MKTPDINSILANLQQQQVREWKIKTPQGLEIETDGTEADHRRALEALALLQQANSPAPIPTPLPTTSDPGMTLERCVLDYLTEREGELNKNTITTYMSSFNKLQDGLGKTTPIQHIDSTRFVAWRKTQDATLHPDTVTRDCGAYRGLFDWAIRRNRYTGQNPIEDADYTPTQRQRLIRERSNPYVPFTGEDLSRIFAKVQEAQKPCGFFLPILALYTGARLNELASLHLDNIIHVDGIYSIKIIDSKTRAGIRHIPLHPDVVRSGFIDYLNEMKACWPGAELVFPHLKAAAKNGLGNLPGRDFSLLKQGLGLGPDKVFHSFRKTLISCLQYNGCSREWRKLYVGHELGDDDGRDVHDLYSKADFTPARLAELIFPHLDLAKSPGFTLNFAYKPKQFNAFLQRTQLRQGREAARRKRAKKIT